MGGFLSNRLSEPNMMLSSSIIELREAVAASVLAVAPLVQDWLLHSRFTQHKTGFLAVQLPRDLNIVCESSDTKLKSVEFQLKSVEIS